MAARGARWQTAARRRARQGLFGGHIQHSLRIPRAYRGRLHAASRPERHTARAAGTRHARRAAGQSGPRVLSQRHRRDPGPVREGASRSGAHRHLARPERRQHGEQPVRRHDQGRTRGDVSDRRRATVDQSASARVPAGAGLGDRRVLAGWHVCHPAGTAAPGHIRLHHRRGRRAEAHRRIRGAYGRRIFQRRPQRL